MHQIVKLGTHFPGKILQKPDWNLSGMLHLSRTPLNFLTTTFSKILAIICHLKLVYNCYEEKLDFFFQDRVDDSKQVLERIPFKS